MNFLPNTDKDREEMLKTIGVHSIDELFSDVPPNMRYKGSLNIPPALSEYELSNHMRELAEKNKASGMVSFIGAGTYDHYIPSVVRHVLSRSEFYTAYTPVSYTHLDVYKRQEIYFERNLRKTEYRADDGVGRDSS